MNCRAALALVACLGAAACVASATRSGALTPLLNRQALAACPFLATHDFAFTSNADGDSDIYLYQGATQSILKLTDNDAQDHWATWSPDGARLAFQSLRDGNREIYVLELATGELRNISRHPGQDLLPAWSPDGNHIAFLSSRDRSWNGEGPLGGDIFLAHPDGSGLRRLEAEGFYSTSSLAWSPDGRTIAYARFGEGRQGLYLFDVESGEERQVLALEGAAPGLAAWTASGEGLLYYLDHETGADLFVLSLSDSRSRRVTRGEGRHYYVSSAPDGTQLLTTSAQDAEGRVYDIRCQSLDGDVDVAVIDDPSDARAAAVRPSRPVRPPE